MSNKYASNISCRSWIKRPRLFRFVVITLFAIILAACSGKAIQIQADQQVEAQQETKLPSVAGDSVVNTQLKSQYQAGVDALKNGDHSKAQRIFREFIRSNPKLAGAYINLALIHFHKKENEKSLKLVTRAIELNDQLPQGFNLRAQLLIKEGKINQAKADYLTAIQLNTGYANAQYNLALLYDIYLQEIALAIEHYEIYLSLINHPDEPTREWVDQLKRTMANG